MIRYLKFKLKYLYGDLQRKRVNCRVLKEDRSFYQAEVDGWRLVDE